MRFLKNVNIVLTDTVGTEKLPTQNGIGEARIVGLYARAEGNSLSNKVIDATVFDSVLLTLKQGTDTVIDNLPLSVVQQQNAAQGTYFELDLDSVAWEDSYITIGKANDITTGRVVELIFVFEK